MNTIHASGKKQQADHSIKQNVPLSNPGIRNVQASNEDLASKMANALNDQNKVPLDMRPKNSARQVSAEVGIKQNEEPRNVIEPLAEQARAEAKANQPTVSTGGTSSKSVEGTQSHNVIQAGPKPQVLETQQHGGKQPVKGAIIHNGPVKNVTPQDLKRVPQADYIHINKMSEPRFKREPKGILQEMAYSILNSDDADKMFETLKDDETALKEIKNNHPLFSDCKLYQELINRYNTYKGNRGAWQRIRR